MKQTLYILIILLNFNSCKAQKNTKMEQEIIIPEITNKFEKLEKTKDINNDTVIIEEQSYGYIRREFLKNSYLVLNKKYYSNGFIKQKAISFINGYPISYVYEFDENGNLIKTINTDEGYGFNWKQIIIYCEKNKIPLTKGFKEFDGFQTRIFKNEIDSKKIWEITYQISGDELLKITLDGKTGKELKKEKLEFINH